MKPCNAAGEAPERIKLTGMLAKFRQGLEEEIEKIKKSGQSSTLLYGGRRIESRGGDYWYRFKVEYLPALPADTPCKLHVGQDRFDVTVISLEEDTLVVACKKLLPGAIVKARLENNITVLMEHLIECIEKNAEKENAAGRRMLPSDGGVYAAQDVFSYDGVQLRPNNTDSQNRAIIAALTKDIAYIWGPPGTGKTTVIGQIMEQLYRRDRSVLVVSHTNTAVDGAIKKAYDRCGEAEHEGARCPILRIGTPARPLPDRVLLQTHMEDLGKELCEQKAVLEQRRTENRWKLSLIGSQLAMADWLNKSNLLEIRRTMGRLRELARREAQVQGQLLEWNGRSQREKAMHPEYASYLALERGYRIQVIAHMLARYALGAMEIYMDDIRKKICLCEDERRKHARYEQLKRQEEQFMSAQFLREERTKAQARMAALADEIRALEEERGSLQRAVEQYERKNSLAKLFVRKSTISGANARIQAIEQLLAQRGEAAERQDKLAQEYKRQLDDLLLIQEQMRSLTPSHSKDYWAAAERTLQTELAGVQAAHAATSTRRDAFLAELNRLESRRTAARAAFEAISALEQKIGLCREELAKIQGDIRKQDELCAGYLEQERMLCTVFFELVLQAPRETVVEKLVQLRREVTEQLAGVDIPALCEEKKRREKEQRAIDLEWDEVNRKLAEIEKQAIMEAGIVGATLAKSYLSEELRERTFDTVILDEASMASIPALWCAAYLARSSIVIVGDFLQLPPIVMAETPMARKWLGQDIFYHSGMQQLALNRDQCPRNFVMLNDQFRMESDIADIANMYYGQYGGLRSHDQDESRVLERKAFYEWYGGEPTGHNVHLIDTQSLHAWVTGVPQGRSHSRLNCFSAAVDVDLAFKMLEKRLNALAPDTAEPVENASVLIIAPYKPHIARINQLIELEYEHRGFRENLNLIRAGTIHSFQGSEADIVIFDLVVDQPHWKANLFMTDPQVNDSLRKMFNVAITRARFQLYIVGNFDYCQKRARGNALAELLDKLLNEDGYSKVDAKQLLPRIAFSRRSEFSAKNLLWEKHIVCREETFNDYFMEDVRTFRERLIIYSPFMAQDRLSALWPDFTDAIAAGKAIIVITKAISDRSRAEAAQYEKWEDALRKIGVSVIHKKGMHEKLIFVDDRAVWIGSLNALSFSGLTGEVMQRHEDRKLTSEYEKLFDIPYICAAAQNRYEQSCPICGGDMLVKEGDSGGIYWECASKDYSRSAAQPYPKDGILRCTCGAPYTFAMKNEPRWVCSANPKHFIKMRENDLKLEKMAALIPTQTARREVEIFFAQKRGDREMRQNRLLAGKKRPHAASAPQEQIEQLKMF